MIPPKQIPGDKTLPTPDPSQVQIIRTYGPGRFLIAAQEWRQPVLVAPMATTAWNVSSADELALAMEARCYQPGIVRTRLHPLRAGRADVLLLVVTAAVIAAGLLV